MLETKIDCNFRTHKIEELIVHTPRVVYVNKFSEEAALKFSREMMDVKNTQPIIPVVIDSYGGEVYSLLSMVDVIHKVQEEIPVATIVMGKAMSCGAVLFTQGTDGHRYIGPNASLMIHDVSSGSFGKTEEVTVSAKENSRLNDKIYALMATGCGKKDPKFFWKLVHQKGRADWFLAPEEARKHNIANHIGTPSLKVNLSYDIKLSV